MECKDMPKVEAAFILALGLHHGYWVNLRESKDMRKQFATLKKGQEVELLTSKGAVRKKLTVMDKNNAPYSVKVMDNDGDNPVERGDWLSW